MKKKVLKALGKTAAKRASGSKVALIRAQLVSGVVGIAAAFGTYRLLRSSS